MRIPPAVMASFMVLGGCCTRSAPGPSSAGIAAAPAPVIAAAPPATADACRACRGDWGVHGLATAASCNCRTSDAGKRCTDGAECQGMCIAAPEPEKEVVDAGPPARGLFVGKCSELVTVFGCNRIIERGARGRGPVPLAEPPMSICVD